MARFTLKFDDDEPLKLDARNTVVELINDYIKRGRGKVREYDLIIKEKIT